MKTQKSNTIRCTAGIIALSVLLLMSLLPNLAHSVWAQFPTVSIPTVTSSPRGLYVRAIGDVENPLNVRSYPNSTSTRVGIFLVGQEAKAYGYYGDYVMIDYAGAPDNRGWIILNRVEVFGGSLPMLQPPPTETPSITKTIDPTLAAQFIITAIPSRLPTFTEPPALQIPTYPAEVGGTTTVGVPIGYIIVILAGFGLFLTLIAVLRRG
ncbi:MAG: hypothetical protein PHW11_07460 [Anaerolineaceae bacterium]|jgi:hypothetical protein|nr:hypothetical protein [Anaerolineaceae bacterium]MDD4042939.1 hypothetical protein [Anaerolineaceae bacterium]MDD4577347.1 hypothetical protein [Anaerolineaceae bacterium]